MSLSYEDYGEANDLMDEVYSRCKRCGEKWIRCTLDDPCPNGCAPVRTGGDLRYFRFSSMGFLFAWHPEEKEVLYMADKFTRVSPMCDAKFEEALQTAREIPYSNVPTSLRLAVHCQWGVTVKRRSVRAI